jgi:hypothetical protein
MPKFLFSYRMANNYTGGPEAMEAWGRFFDTIGSNVIDKGNPVFEATSLGNCGADTHVGGYTFVTAEDLESAVAIAKGAPALAHGGGVEVGEITEIM